MNRPSGLQAGSQARSPWSSNTGRGFDPSASISHRLLCPPRSEMKAIVDPSGDRLG